MQKGVRHTLAVRRTFAEMNLYLRQTNKGLASSLVSASVT